MSKIIQLQENITQYFAEKIVSSTVAKGELTIVVAPENLIDVMKKLHDEKDFDFKQCVDVCGVDYSTYKDSYQGKRFAVVYHLLSITKNIRLRVRTFAENDDFPTVPSVIDIWNSVNWFEREAFDLFGILFDGHPDLRRILTDYGFIGHPFRKDFPLSGYVEMIFDEAQNRVVYQPVTIEPREITPRVIREESYCGRN